MEQKKLTFAPQLKQPGTVLKRDPSEHPLRNQTSMRQESVTASQLSFNLGASNRRDSSDLMLGAGLRKNSSVLYDKQFSASTIECLFHSRWRFLSYLQIIIGLLAMAVNMYSTFTIFKLTRWTYRRTMLHWELFVFVYRALDMTCAEQYETDGAFARFAFYSWRPHRFCRSLSTLHMRSVPHRRSGLVMVRYLDRPIERPVWVDGSPGQQARHRWWLASLAASVLFHAQLLPVAVRQRHRHHQLRYHALALSPPVQSITSARLHRHHRFHYFVPADSSHSSEYSAYCLSNHRDYAL